MSFPSNDPSLYQGNENTNNTKNEREIWISKFLEADY
jgi:hypothetical protein